MVSKLLNTLFNSKLNHLDARATSITDIDLSKCQELKRIDLYGCEKLTKLDVQNLRNLEDCNVRDCTQLIDFSIGQGNNNLQSLDISNIAVYYISYLNNLNLTKDTLIADNIVYTLEEGVTSIQILDLDPSQVYNVQGGTFDANTKTFTVDQSTNGTGGMLSYDYDYGNVTVTYRIKLAESAS